MGGKYRVSPASSFSSPFLHLKKMHNPPRDYEGLALDPGSWGVRAGACEPV